MKVVVRDMSSDDHSNSRRLKIILLSAFFLLVCPALSLAEEVPGHVRGCVKADIEGPYHGVASLWDASSGRQPDPKKHIIIPSSFSVIRPDGCFEIVAPPGNYYVGAIVRLTQGSHMGPPRKGDLVFMTPDKNHESLVVKLESSEVVDLGVKSDSWVYDGFDGHVSMGVRGHVVDLEGQPVAGLLVFAFQDPQVSTVPLAVSEVTSADGHFELRLDRPGQIYLRVKENYGEGMPSPGGYVGIYGNEAAEPVVIKKNIVIDKLKISVMKVPEEMTGAKRRK